MKFGIFVITLFFATLSFSQSTILFDHGNYALNFSDIDNVRWQSDRHYQVVVRTTQDIAVLKNISVETSKASNEELVGAVVQIKSNGPTITYPIDSFKTQPFDADWTEHLLVAEALKTGDTLDVRFSILSDVGTTIQRWTIQHAYPVLKSTVTMLVPEVFEYEDFITHRQFLTKEEALDSTIRLDRGRVPLKGLSLTFGDIPAYSNEPLSPELIERRAGYAFAITKFSLGENQAYMPPWNEQTSDLILNDWFGKQYRVRQNYRWLLAEANSLFNKVKYEDHLFLLKMYDFIHDTFTWDGSYGLFPSHTIPEMARQRSVNKSALNIAMMALLNEAGYKAYPILVSTTDQPAVATDIPDINQFNHFVIAVELGKEVIYIDCGDANLPIGWIDSGIRNTTGVHIRNFKSTWVPLPSFKAQSAMIVSIDVHEDLSATGTIDATFVGYDAHTERNLLASDRAAAYWKERGSALSPDLRIDSVRFENVHNLLEPFKQKVFFHIDASLDHEEFVINPVFYSFFTARYLEDSTRSSAIVFPFPMTEQTVINAQLDEHVEITSLPETIRLRLDGDPSNMLFQTSSSNGGLQSRFQVTLDKQRFPATAYPAVKTFLDNIALKIDEAIVIRPK